MRAGDFALAQESGDDWWEVEALFDLCFAPGRSALSSYRLRDDVAPVAPLCVTARDDGGILAGAVRNWPIRIGRHKALLLGPIAVHPTRQGEGLAAVLMGYCMDRAAHLGWSRIMLVGDVAYYSRFGFAPLSGVEMPPPTNPDRVLGIALVPGAWAHVRGTVSKAID